MADHSSIDRKEEKEKKASSKGVIDNSKRPRLNYLRSAWTTSDLYYHESAFSQTSICTTTSSSSSQEEEEENLYAIKLPLVQLQDCDDEEEESDEILKEIFKMISIANIICLTSSILNTSFILSILPSFTVCIDQQQQWLPHLILPFYIIWWIFMILVLKHRTTEHLLQYLNWAQLSSFIMTFTNYIIPIQHQQHILFKSIIISSSILPCFIYIFAKRMSIANELKYNRFKKRISQQQDKLQQDVNKHTTEFNEQRTNFLITVSQEIQDVALMVITTLEQFSPTSVLFNTPELLSACSIAVPIASISAINTTIRQVCHVSSHLELLSKLTLQSLSTSKLNQTLPKLNQTEFDIGELLQNLGDALAGVAAKLDVNLVIYHCDNTLHHTLVIGDEGAIRHALLNHIRNILECCTPGASIEVGLKVNQIRDPKKLNVTFYITHTTSPAIRHANVALLPNANLTAQLLSYIHATCTVDAHKNQTKFEFSFELTSGKKDNNNKMCLNKEGANYLLRNHYANIKFSNEPSLKELHKFISHLKGLKMVLHAPERSIFAKHLTSCLASWNTDISHVPVTHADDVNSVCSSGTDTPDPHSNVTTPILEQPNRQPSTPPIPTPAIEEEHIHSIPPAFILIDDDVTTLENKLSEFRTQPAASANMLQQARRNNNNNNNPYFQQQQQQQQQQHGRKSSNQNFFHQGTTAIIHFTSLSNYKAVRDTIQCCAVLPSRDPFSMPRVVVVPKPAGPRRFLTALHTAWNNAVVEPHFSAIATSPSSPMPPMMSMLVQREIAAAAATQQQQQQQQHSPAENRISPGNENISPGRPRRPTSGIFSPPTVDNYFSSQHPRRRSTNNTLTNEIDYLTSKTPPTTIETHDKDIQPPIDTVPMMEPTKVTTPPVAIQQQQEKEKEECHVVTPQFDEPSEPTSQDTTTTVEPILKKKVGRTMSNFKLHKKKRKEKGKPFADVVSPPINVLIVEDNIINQAILSAWMKKHKIKFSVASNGLEAVNKWKIGGFHLILMDIQLPVMNGIEATKMIRSIEKEQKIGVLPMSSSFLRQQQEVASATAETIMNQEPFEQVVAAEMMMLNQTQDTTAPSIFRSPVIIVALTASSLESDRHAALAAGCNDFLTKPVSLEWLEKKIIEWGCMQALIDFEGWRRWKKKSNGEDNKKKLTSFTTVPSPQTTLLLTAEQIEAEKKRIEEKSKLLIHKNNGILLPGISHLMKSKRQHSISSPSSSNRIVLKASKSESDTHTLSRIIQQESTSDTTTNNSSVLLTQRSRSTSREKKFDTKIQKDKSPHKPESRSSSSS